MSDITTRGIVLAVKELRTEEDWRDHYQAMFHLDVERIDRLIRRLEGCGEVPVGKPDGQPPPDGKHYFSAHRYFWDDHRPANLIYHALDLARDTDSREWTQYSIANDIIDAAQWLKITIATANRLCELGFMKPSNRNHATRDDVVSELYLLKYAARTLENVPAYDTGHIRHRFLNQPLIGATLSASTINHEE